ncbi:MAG: pectate lyase [Vicinamibacterales bacterium]|jgi:PelA/Pel-15E family pectate lyase|nr:pectate lyase [Vicinamibacterales bacterium]
MRREFPPLLLALLCLAALSSASSAPAEGPAAHGPGAGRVRRTGPPVPPGAIAPQVTGTVTRVRWDPAVLLQQPGWYGSVEARAVADSVIQYQSRHGGWPKSTDLAVAPRSPDDIPPPGGGRADSLDNDATTLPMQFLARVAHATGEARYREAFSRGVDYLLAAQYPNGGWPQFYPLRGEYYSRITYNDGAMVRALTVLRDTAAGRPPYDFVDAIRRARAGAAVERGIDCIVRSQIRQDGKLTAWGAQHDEQTLAPAWARTYEPPSLSGSESVGVVRFLMEIEQPTPAIVAAVQGAVEWFGAVTIRGLRLEEFIDAEGRKDRRVVAASAAAPLWARFYELGTNRPIFLGRDSVVRYSFAEIELERRIGYQYYGTWPATLLSRDYPNWRLKHNLAGRDRPFAAGTPDPNLTNPQEP